MIENRYKEHYKPDVYITNRGRVVEEYLYDGDYYILPLEGKERKKAAAMNILISIVMMALFVLTGLFDNAGSRRFYILIPYICIFMPAFYMLMGACSFLSVPERMQIAHYDRSLLRSKRSCIGIMVIAVLVLLTDLIFLILNRQEIELMREFGFMGGLFGMILTGVIFGKNYQHFFGKITIEKAQKKAAAKE